jgi:shikimate dehydrogenase
MRSIDADTQQCMVIGYPLAGSLSPLLHNAGYEALGIEKKFVFTAARVEPQNLKQAVEGIRAFGIRGVSVTIPHKQTIIPYLDKLDSLAEQIGAVNTVLNENGKLTGFNTDWQGVIIPLDERARIHGMKVAIIGAGGAARAAAFGLTVEKDCKVSIFNRTLSHAQELAKAFGGEAYDFNEFERLRQFDIIIQATPVGAFPRDRVSIVPQSVIEPNQIVFDMVYAPYDTLLLEEAAAVGARTVPGVEMLLHQGTAQFELYTGNAAPVEAMRKVLFEHLGL